MVGERAGALASEAAVNSGFAFAGAALVAALGAGTMTTGGS
jgi:hypothetical protein